MTAAALDWSGFAACEECGADRGRPCLDLRYSPATGRFHTNRPHRGRVTEEARR